jgi:hypothetical protein
MKRSLIVGLAFSVLFSSASASSATDASLRAQLIGTWRYVSIITKDELTWIPFEATGGGRGRGVLRRVK